MDDQELHEAPDNTVFKDVLFIVISMLVVMSIIMMPFVQPVGDAEVDSSGDMIIEMSWAADSESDIDLWVQSPDDAPVSFRRKNGRTLSLLRDDRGKEYDLSEQNYEFMYSRGLPEGKYTVNSVMYSYRGEHEGKDKIYIKVSYRSKLSNKFITIWSSRFEMSKTGEERTFIQFEIDEESRLVKDSIDTNTQHSLRKALNEYNFSAPDIN